MKEKLYEIYEMAVDYLNGKDINPTSIISEAAGVYGEYDVPEQLKEVLSRCMLFTNKDFESELTIGEYINKGDSLIEELSGFLGEYFE